MNKPWSEKPIAARDANELVEELESRRLMSSSGDVALIDTSLPNFRDLSAAVADRDNVILYDGQRDSASKVLGKLAKWAAATKQQIHNVSILSHGKAGAFQLGKDWITSEAVQKKAWQKLKDVLADDASIYLFGCNVASNTKGQTLLNHLATLSGANVYGSTDLTGGARKGGDWVLEASSTSAPKTKPAAAAPLSTNGLANWNFTLAAGITVTPTSPSTTSEAGGTATFDIVLDEAPLDDVTIPIASNNTAEGTVSTASVTFTPADWSVPQSVTVTGQNDNVDDGDQDFLFEVGPATSNDSNYDGLGVPGITVNNVDDDTAGITVTPTSGLTTTEVGGTATFDVYLNSQPTADVTITLSSSNTAEGTVSTTTLVFTAANWNTPQTVTVTGQNEQVDDGDVAYTIATNAATSADSNYNGLNPSNVSVTNTDNDTAGITVTPTSGLTTTEAGGTAQFDVVLNSQPTADVTIGIGSSNTAEGTVSVASVTFTAANWNVAQTVTVTGQNEFVDDGNVAYTIVTAAATSADTVYGGMNASDVSVTNTDNDTAGITVTPTSGLSTTEAAGTAQFTVVLDSRPTANVVIGISSSATGEGTVSASSITFTTANWNVAQTITVTGQNEFVDDGDQSYSIVTAPATSSDGVYSGMNASDVSVTNIDNDTAGINVTAISGNTTEAGGTATFSITLNSRPLNSVVIGISTGDATEGTVSTSSISIPPGQWNNPQVVTVTGVNDLIDDGDVVYSIVTAAAASGDGLYSGMDASDVSVTNVDNDTAGITVTPTSGLTTTEAGGTANFTVVLNTQPVNDVIIGISSNDLTEGTVSASSLTFTNANWNVAQTVTVTGVDDLYDDGNISYGVVTAAATSADAPYNGLDAGDVSLSNTDNDTAGFTITPTSGLTTTESGGTATFTVRLNTIPFADVTLGVSSNDLTEGTVGAPSLTFTAANWNVDQTVTITGANDFLDDGNIGYSIVTAAATSADGSYNGLNPSDVTVSNTDNDTAGVTVTPTSGLSTTEAGGTATFDVVLDAQPTANVTIAVSSSNTSEGTVSTALLTFTNANWNVPQTVTVTGQNDNVDDDNIAYTIVTGATSSGDATFNGLAVSDVSVTNVDNDTAGITVTPTSGLVTTEANGQATFDVVLNTQPTANVVINVSTTDATEGTILTSSLTFTTANWSTPQTVTVTGANDFLDDGDIAYSITTAAAVSGDAKYSGMNPSDVSLTNTDNDTAGITVTPTSGLVTTEAGGTANFGVVLTSQPTADVTIAVNSSNTAEGTVSTALLTFTAANWSVTQTVTVTGVNEFVDDGDIAYTIVTGAATSADGSYSGMAVSDVSVTNTDNDTAGFTVTPTTGLSTTEAGGQASFTIRLTSQPTADVTIGIASNDLTEGTVSTTLLTFTSANWNVDQTVTVTGVDDLVSDGNIAYGIVTAAAVSADANYSGLNASDVSISNTDNDVAGITVTPTSGLVTTEAGSTATFDVVLTSQPTADVVITLASSDLTEGTISTGTLTFTTANWNVAQTVTVTGVDDNVDDDNVAYSVVTAAASSADTNYNTLNAADVSVTTSDDDTAGITVSPTSGLTTSEAGSEVTFDVVLDSQPTSNVTIGISTGDATEGTVSTSLLTFTPANWNTPQTVTISSVDDTTQDGNITYSIITSAAASADTKYNGLNPANVSVTSRDNDPNGVKLGSEFRINTTTSNVQNFASEVNRSIAMDASGNFVVVWTSLSQDGSGYGIYAQRYNTSGVAQGSEFRVNTTTSGDQRYRTVAMDASGNFVVTWASNLQDGSGWGVYAQRYNAAGVAQGSEFRVNSTTSGDQSFPNVSMNSSTGDFVIAWTSDGQDGSGAGVYAQRYDATGVAQGAEFRVNATTSNDQHQASIAVSSNGSFVIAFTSNNDVYVRRYNASGVAQGSEFLVNVNTGKTDNNPAVAIDASGNFVVTWNSNHQDAAGNRYGIFARRYNAAGTAQGSDFQVNTFTGGNQRYPSISMDVDGDFVIVWSSDTRDGSGWGVFGQQYQSDGTARGGEFRVNSYTTNDQLYGSVALDATGDYTVVWSSDGQDGSLEGIYGQRFEGGNDAPVNSVPGAQSVNEDATLTFSSANGNLISVSDVDVSSSTLRVTLTVTNGLLTLNGVTGLTFTTGDGTADATMVFTGTAADINTALHGMAFAPTANYNGAASLQITTDDLGNSGWDGAMNDTDSVAITVNAVNDAPVNSVPGAQVTNEDTSLVLSNANGNRISVADLDVASGNLRVTLTATNGVLTLSGTTGLTFTTGDGTADQTMTFSGAPAALNAALDGLIYTPTADYNGAASIQITTNDLGNTGSGGATTDTDSVAITVNAVNDAPVNSVPAAQVTSEDTSLIFSTGNGNLISIADLDASTSSVRVTLTVSNGLLTLNGAFGLSFTTGDGVADSTMTFTGTLTDINAALDGMTFAPTANYNGAASLQITTNDQGNTGTGGSLSDSDSVAITINAVNDPPVNTVPGAQATNEDTPLVFSSGTSNLISINDIDAGASSVRVTLTSTNGTLTLSQLIGLSFTTGDGSADATMTFTGSQTDMNAALNGLTFAPTANFNGAASVQITTNDLGNAGSGGAHGDTDSVAITVNAINDAPVLAGANAMPAIDEDDVTNTGMLVSTLVGGQITDVDSSPLEGIAVTAVDNTNGTWQYTTDGSIWLSFGSPGDATARLLAADANTRVRFVPNANYNGTASITFRAWDQTTGANGGTASTSTNGGTTAFSSAIATPVLTINAINDAPFNNLPAAQSTNEDTSLVLSSGNGNAITISDVDHLGGNLRVTMTASNGLLTLGGVTGLGFTVGDGASDATMTFSGTLAAINAALNGLTFAPTSNYNGPATIQVQTSDLGNSGAGGSLTDTDTLNITINAVNDGPVNTVPAAQVTNEDTPLVFSTGNGNAISIADLDHLGNALQVTLTATNGTLTLAQLTGLSFTTGDGVADATLVFTGTLADINAALNGLTFAPTTHYNGAASVQIQTSDEGNTGIGGALTDSDTVAITVNAVNDAPVITAPASDSTNEDTPRIFSSGNGNLISIADVDSATGELSVVLSALHGTLSLAGTTGLTFLIGDGTSDATMTFTGTLADINAALASLTYAPSQHYNGADTLHLVVSDQGNTGSGGALSDSHDVALTINAVNDAPVNTIPGAQVVDEDDLLSFSTANGNSISIADLDLLAGTARVTLAATNGLLTLNGTSGLTFITGDGVANATIVFTGTIADINAALNGLVFDSNSNYNGPATLSITTNDQGNTGIGGALSDTDVVNITVNAVNDAPVINVPVAQAVNEDTDLVFSAFDGNLISISDLDAASGLLQVTLAATNGTLTLATLAGLSFSTGDGTSDASMTFTGTLASINAALDGMTFRGDASFNGAANVQISVDDQANTGSGGAQVDLEQVAVTVGAINDAPVNNVPNLQTTDEDTPLVFSTPNGNAISVSDVDVLGNLLRVTLAGNNGVLTLGQVTGLSFTTGDGVDDGTMTFTGTLADINAALEGLAFAPNGNYNGPESITITTSDLGNTGVGGPLVDTDVIDINVVAVNDPPVAHVPPAQTTDEDTDLVFSTTNGNVITIVDPDAGSQQVLLTITATNGTLTLGDTSGLSFVTGDGVADTTMTFRGKLNELNAALEGLIFSPNANYNGAAQIDFTCDDQGHSGSGGSLGETKSVAVNVTAVNDAPVNNIPAPQTVLEDNARVFSTANGNVISISDVDVAGGLLRVRLTAANGTVTLAQFTGLTFIIGDGTSDATMTFTGTLVDINAALDGLALTPDLHFNGPTTLNLHTDDLGNVGTGGALTDDDNVSVTVNAVNDAPVNTLPTAQITDEDTILTLGGGNRISVSDLDVLAGELQITLTATNGVLTLAQLTGLTFTTGDGSGDAVMTFTGAPADINAALDGMTFAPTTHYNGPASIQIATSDQGNSGLGGAQVDVDTLNITVDAVNDAPVNTVPPARSTNEDTPLVFSTANGNAISLTDLDAATLQVTLSVTNGTLTLAQLTGLTFITGDGAADATLVFTGTLADINAALDGIAFNPSTHYNGLANLQIATSDLGATGSGGTLVDTDSVAITVNAVNDAPVNTIPGIQTVNEDGTLVFSTANGNRILIADLDANGQDVQVTLTATNGLLTLGTTAGLIFTTGNGIDDATLVFTGTLAEINAALQGLIYRPLHDFAGNASIQIVTDDLGHTGLGGAQTDTDTVDIFVSPINDAPVITTTPGTLGYTENDTPTAIDPGLVIVDVDDTNLNAAQVVLVGYVAGEDLLSFIDQNGITGSWDASTGVLTLTGIASVADYQAALRSVTYSNLSDNLTTTPRTAYFVVGDGQLHNGPASRTITMTAVNDAPVGDDLSITLNEDFGSRGVDLWQLFSDIDNEHSDIALSIVSSSNPALFSGATIDPATGELLLGSAHDAFGTGVITLRAQDKDGLTTDTALTVTVDPVNDAPVVAASDDTVPFNNAAPTVVIDPDVVITDVDSATLNGATVRIANHVTGRDVLEFENQNGITGTFDAGTGVLTLSGVATVAQYQAALRSVEYTSIGINNSGDVLAIEFSVSDGDSAVSIASARGIQFPAEVPTQTPPTPQIPDEPTHDDEPVSDPLPPLPPTLPKPPARPVVDVPIPPHTGETPKPVPAPQPPPAPPPVPPVIEEPQPTPPPAEPEPVVVAPPVPAPVPVAPPPVPVVAKPPAVQTEKLWRKLDEIAQQLDSQNAKPKINVGSVAGMTTTLLSVGYVIWCLRGGALVATLLTTLPLWRWLDPLPVLDGRRDDDDENKQKDDDEERIRTMMD